MKIDFSLKKPYNRRINRLASKDAAPIESEEQRSPFISRREFLVAAAGAAATAAAIDKWMLPDHDAYRAPTVSYGDAEDIHRLIDDGEYEALFHSFEITTEDAPTPSAFAELLSHRILRAMTAGCTPEEAAQFTLENLEAYHASTEAICLMAARALSGDTTSEDDRVRETGLFRFIRDANSQMQKAYLRFGGRETESPEIVPYADQEMLAEDGANRRFSIKVDLGYELEENAVPFTAKGSFNFNLHVPDDKYRVALGENNQTNQLQFVHG